MTIDISQHVLRLKGQRVNEIELAEDGAKVIVQCSRDARRSAIDSRVAWIWRSPRLPYP